MAGAGDSVSSTLRASPPSSAHRADTSFDSNTSALTFLAHNALGPRTLARPPPRSISRHRVRSVDESLTGAIAGRKYVDAVPPCQ